MANYICTYGFRAYENRRMIRVDLPVSDGPLSQRTGT